MSSRKRCSARRSASQVWHSSVDCPVLLAEIWVSAAPHPGCEGAGVAADVDGRVLLDEVPDLVLVGEHLVLGVLAPFPWLPGEGRVDPDVCGFLEFAHFVGVEVVVLGVPAAEEQQRRGQRFAACLLRGSFLQESAERGEAGTRQLGASGRGMLQSHALTGVVVG